MKILQVNKLYYPWVGGVERIVQQIAEGLNKKNDFEIEVLCCESKGRESVEEVSKVKIYRASSFGIFWGMPFSLSFFKFFKKLSQKADIIDFHHPFPLGNLAIFLFKPKAKLVVHYHSDIVRQKVFGFLIKPLISHTLKKAERILVSNPNLVKNSPYLKKIQGKCQVIPFGVDLNEIENSLDENEVLKIREKYGDFVLFVGRPSYYKGVEYLIEAMKEVNLNLVIIGEERKPEGRVFFLPQQERKKLINFYKAARVFVLPSILKSEAFGIVLIEAMACGTPVISTELGTGTSWVNVDGRTGFVVPPRNPMALAEAIKKILENKKLAQEFSQNAKERAEKKFSLEEMLEKTANLYKIF